MFLIIAREVTSRRGPKVILFAATALAKFKLAAQSSDRGQRLMTLCRALPRVGFLGGGGAPRGLTDPQSRPHPAMDLNRIGGSTRSIGS